MVADLVRKELTLIHEPAERARVHRELVRARRIFASARELRRSRVHMAMLTMLQQELEVRRVLHS